MEARSTLGPGVTKEATAKGYIPAAVRGERRRKGVPQGKKGVAGLIFFSFSPTTAMAFLGVLFRKGKGGVAVS